MHEVIHGDSAVILGHFEDCSIDAVVTDPPHGLFFMGSQWDAELPAQAIWDECFRVLKPGGHMFVMSSERLGCVAGLYMSLRKAGFEVDETQILNWVSLTGMPKSVDVGKVADKQAFRDWLLLCGREFVKCPKHDAKAERCPECERIFAAGNLTHHDKRKVESAAVNGESPNMPGGSSDLVYSESRAGRLDPEAAKQRHSEGASLLSRLLSLHWPASPSEQRAHWEAVVPDVPADWDTSRPPGVRVKTGDSYSRVSVYGDGAASPTGDGRNCFGVNAPKEVFITITRPSTPDAVRFDGWRGSVAPLKPFCYPILHAQKPCEGSYLANWRKWGTGPMGVGECRIPFADAADEANAEFGVSAPSGGDLYQGKPTSAAFDGPPKPADPAGRTPANLLSYADLLGDLQRYADLSAWCEKLGLPESAAAILEAGLVYAPKPSRREKEAGLEGFEAEAPANPNYGKNGFSRPTGQPEREIAPQRNTHPTAKPAALCAYLITLATAPGQTVLDPFCGSGSTGVAAALIGRRFIGVELDAEGKGFCEIARARIAHAARTLAATDDTPAQVSRQPALMEVAAE